MQNTYTKLITGIHKYHKTAGIDKAVIALSGGIDTSLALKLAVDALSKNNVTALLLPEKGVSHDENNIHAKLLCEFLNIEYFTINVNKFFIDYLTLPWKPNNLAQINTKARVRGLILYNFANTRNCLVHGATNKTELSLGYATKYGDLACDLNALGDLYKEDVYELAKHLELPEELIAKTPSAELYFGQTDENELGINYREIDVILRQIHNGISKDELINKGLNPNSVHKIFRLMEINKHKQNMPHIISNN